MPSSRDLPKTTPAGALALCAKSIGSAKDQFNPDLYFIRYAKSIKNGFPLELPSSASHPETLGIAAWVNRLSKGSFQIKKADDKPNHPEIYDHDIVSITPVAEAARVGASKNARIMAGRYGYLFIAAEYFRSWGKKIKAETKPKISNKELVFAMQSAFAKENVLFGIDTAKMTLDHQVFFTYVIPQIVIKQARAFYKQYKHLLNQTMSVPVPAKPQEESKASSVSSSLETPKSQAAASVPLTSSSSKTSTQSMISIEPAQRNEFVTLVRTQMKKLPQIADNPIVDEFINDQVKMQLFTQVIQGLWEQANAQNKPLDIDSDAKLIKQLESIFEKGGSLYKYTKTWVLRRQEMPYRDFMRNYLPALLSQIANSSFPDPQIVLRGSVSQLPPGSTAAMTLVMKRTGQQKEQGSFTPPSASAVPNPANQSSGVSMRILGKVVGVAQAGGAHIASTFIKPGFTPQVVATHNRGGAENEATTAWLETPSVSTLTFG